LGLGKPSGGIDADAELRLALMCAFDTAATLQKPSI
jgi:hypothetical protein